jgi:hypothetical protein
MITPKMKKWLQKPIEKRLTKRGRKTIKYCVYMHRMRSRIDRELDMALWLARNHPSVFFGERRTLNEYNHLIWKKSKRKERLKKLLLVIKALNPKCNIELVLREIENESKT